jgi:hypothetical protein
MSEIEAAVREAVNRLEAAWNANDYAAVAGCFDRDDPMPVYQAEEEAQAAVGWAALDDYFARTGKLNERIAVRYTALTIKLLGSDQALAFWQLGWTIKLATYPRPLGGACRVFALARLRPTGWQFHHYVEAPLSPISYVRTLYEAAAKPELLT